MTRTIAKDLNTWRQRPSWLMSLISTTTMKCIVTLPRRSLRSLMSKTTRSTSLSVFSSSLPCLTLLRSVTWSTYIVSRPPRKATARLRSSMEMNGLWNADQTWASSKAGSKFFSFFSTFPSLFSSSSMINSQQRERSDPASGAWFQYLSLLSTSSNAAS